MEPLTDPREIFSKLAEPFDPADIEWRVGSTNKNEANPKGIALAYITSRAVMQRLDDVVGPENWRNEFQKGPLDGVMCGISIRINGGEWITKWDGADATQIEATKGTYSDSMKRAAVQWGIARYLYALPNVWCRCKVSGKNFVLAEVPTLPEWALPAGYKAPKEPVYSPMDGAESQPEKETPKPQSEPAQSVKKASGYNPTTAAKAMEYKIPTNIPMAGKKLGDVLKDPMLGTHILNYLAGAEADKKGGMYTPSNDDETKLVNAAKYLRSNYEEVKASLTAVQNN